VYRLLTVCDVVLRAQAAELRERNRALREHPPAEERRFASQFTAHQNAIARQIREYGQARSADTAPGEREGAGGGQGRHLASYGVSSALVRSALRAQDRTISCPEMRAAQGLAARSLSPLLGRG